VSKLERHKIIKRIIEVLECMPIDDLRDRSHVLIKHPYMRIILAKDTSVIFDYSNGLFDINHNIIEEKENDE
tara:strand:+ start:6784 stop:6999 length:216 start_codon:yes stop_codon:yes gene_type:complete